MKQSWQDFALAEPELSAFGEARLKSGPAYLATVRADGMPRVHPVTPILGEGHLFLFMEPTSPKGHDFQRGSGYALHCWVSSNDGGEGEFWLAGYGVSVAIGQKVTLSSYQIRLYGYHESQHKLVENP